MTNLGRRWLLCLEMALLLLLPSTVFAQTTFSDLTSFVAQTNTNTVATFEDVPANSGSIFKSGGVMFAFPPGATVLTSLVGQAHPFWFGSLGSRPSFVGTTLGFSAILPSQANAFGFVIACFGCDTAPNASTINWTLYSSQNVPVGSGSKTISLNLSNGCTSTSGCAAQFFGVISPVSFTRVDIQKGGSGGTVVFDDFRYASALDDHNDGGPVQAGYAVVTPSGTAVSGSVATGGLVVFETFGLRSAGQNATQAGVLPPDLTTDALLFVSSNDQLSRNIGVAIVNPNDVTVNLTLTLRRADGTQVTTKTASVPPRQQITQFVTQSFPGESSLSNFTGTLEITSTGGPVSAIGLKFRGTNFSTLPLTNRSTPGVLAQIATGVGGPGAILLPQFAADGGWATEIDIINSGTAPVTLRVDLFKSDGTPLSAALNGKTLNSFANLTIPAGGVLVLAPRDASGNTDF
jgi:hypothetical protein